MNILKVIIYDVVGERYFSKVIIFFLEKGRVKETYWGIYFSGEYYILLVIYFIK